MNIYTGLNVPVVRITGTKLQISFQEMIQNDIFKKSLLKLFNHKNMKMSEGWL